MTMSHAYTGGCACRAIRYEIAAEPIESNDCQCRQCQHQSGTGHSSYLSFVGAPVTIEGKASTWDVVGEGGTVKRCAFCPTCGSPVYLTFPDIPDLFIIRAGSLDEPGRYKPEMVFWHSVAQPWDHVPPETRKYEKLPPR
jgi:hypothetical protein